MIETRFTAAPAAARFGSTVPIFFWTEI